MDVLEVAAGMLGPALAANAWWIVPFVLAVLVLRFPAVGRGPTSSRRDPWRGFKFAARATVLERAGGRCEGGAFLVWGRCGDLATEIDHVMPWSRGGPTVVTNGQALCKGHNRSKGAWMPPWWYVSALERRRRGYFPAEADVRVRAVMTDEDRAARARAGAKRGATRPRGYRAV